MRPELAAVRERLEALQCNAQYWLVAIRAVLHHSTMAMELDPTTAGKILRQAMQRRGLTQKQLSTVSGVGQTTISRILRGADPRYSTTLCLAAVVPELLEPTQ